MQFIRRSLRFVVIMFSVIVLYSCKGAEDLIVYKLTVSENGVLFVAGGGTESIEILPFPEGERWEASCPQPQEWFSYEVHGNSLTVTADSNPSSNPRTGSIVLTSPLGRFEPYDIPVSQEASSSSEVTLSLSAQDYSFDSQGGDYSFTVSSNSEWEVSSDASWLEVDADHESGLVTLTAGPNESETQLSATVTVAAGTGDLRKTRAFALVQGTRAENPYYKMIGSWEISASKWFYSPNGSLNSLDYNPNPHDYYLIFNIEEAEYGKTLLMTDFLYPDTSLEVRYDKESGSIIIPFGWTVYSYDVFMYLTVVGGGKFSYASLEVEGVLSEDGAAISLEMPQVEGFDYVGFGLWTYNDSGNKVALGSRNMPTMFPMGDIVFRKQSL